jgi:hypothetical protein
MTQLRREDSVRQSTYTFNARTTGMLTQAASLTETMRLTAMAINRASTFAAQAKPSVYRFRLAQAPDEAMLRTTSGESGRTSLIVFF